ncbi:hypothetical protein [Amycolatopsis keratiniphila]|uniref:hypothetical protein n=1 Tax=Amycolatopsis keratiniphila TaxID=129921 RepID=UPI001E2A1988|nr:hypothetical protein [Amycolatopsis keratiniphila]
MPHLLGDRMDGIEQRHAAAEQKDSFALTGRTRGIDTGALEFARLANDLDLIELCYRH